MGLTNIRINNAGCMERCELGPVMVIYPEGVWYHYNTQEDIEEILQVHVCQDDRVERLMLDDELLYFPYAPAPKLTLEVCELEEVADSVLLVNLKSAQGEDLPSFTPGAHIDLFVDDSITRKSFSLINHTHTFNQYSIAIWLEENGRGGSKWLHENLALGTRIQASFPLNRFELNETKSGHLLFAQGKGIASLLPLCLKLQTTGSEFTVHYALDGNPHAVLLNQLELICQGRLHTYCNETDCDGLGVVLDNLNTNPTDAQLYIAGSQEFVDSTIGALSKWSQESMRVQYLSCSQPEQSDNFSFRVSLSRQRKVIQVPPDKTIVDALNTRLVQTDFICQDGLCGACRTKVLAGEVDHRDLLLTDLERMEGQMMLCQSRAKREESMLVLDLLERYL